MPKSLWAKVSQGKIEFLEPTDLPEGASVLVTIFPDSDSSPSDPPTLPQPAPDLWLEPELDDEIWDSNDDGNKPFLPLSESLQASRSE